MRLSDLAGMDLLPDWHDSPIRDESFKNTLQRISAIHELWSRIVGSLPCNSAREQYVLMVLFADACSAAAAQLRRAAEAYKDQELSRQAHFDDVPF